MKFVHADAWNATLPDDAGVFLQCGRTFGEHFTQDPSTALPVDATLIHETAKHAVRREFGRPRFLTGATTSTAALGPSRDRFHRRPV